jgi:hypothetical protein
MEAKSRAAWLLAIALMLSGGCQLVLDFSEKVGGEATIDAANPDAREPDIRIEPCENGVVDGEETAIDCGGSTCAPCPTGSACLATRDCVSFACAMGVCEDHPRNCASAISANPAAPSGVVTIDPDGSGPTEPFNVYCEQTLATGGWQLVSVVPQGGVVPPGATAAIPFVGAAYCLDPTTGCAGQIHPSQVSAALEIAVLDVTTGDYLVLTQFSATAESALRFFSLEKALTTSDLCTAPHACSNATLDPDLVVTTSGYAMAYTPPLLQWWRLSGWYIGAGPVAGSMDGNVFRTSYNRVNALSTRATAAGLSTIRAQGNQRVYARLPAVPAAP